MPQALRPESYPRRPDGGVHDQHQAAVRAAARAHQVSRLLRGQERADALRQVATAGGLGGEITEGAGAEQVGERLGVLACHDL